MAGGAQVLAALKRWEDRRWAAAVLLAQHWATHLEGVMKDTAPWQDRTGQARQRLKGEALQGTDGVSIILSHGVDYGKYLELAHDGKYAILWPTAKEYAPKIMADFRRVFGR